MLTKEEIQLYDRQIRVKDFGIESQIKLKNSKILVIGAGGLACPALQYLCSAGIGEIHICDGDTVSISNLQRQILYSKDDVGKFKTEVAKQQLQKINPFVKIHTHVTFLNKENAAEFINAKNIVLDCSDNFGTRYLVNDVCCALGIPFISAALFQTQAQFGIFNIPLKGGNYSANYRDAFPESDKNGHALDCNEAGVIASLPGLLGLYQANECIKYLSSPEKCFINKILVLDAWNLKHFTYEIKKSISNPILLSEIHSHQYNVPCVNEDSRILNDSTLSALLQNDNSILIVDVREIHELPKSNHPLITQIPLSVFTNNLKNIPANKTILFVCKAGMRSKKALEIFQDARPLQKSFSYNKSMNDLLNLPFFINPLFDYAK